VNEISAARYRLAWCNPKLERRTTPAAGDGLFAAQPIAKGELLVVWGGVIVSTEDLFKLPLMARYRAIQVEVDHHLTSGMIDDDADCVNHSCNPNSGLQGQITLVAMRDIAANEEIAFDYAMSDAHPSFYMECACDHPHCRGKVTGDDWKRPELQERYKGYFSPYIQRMIDAQHR
jgi:uncharacterized protein